MATKAKVAPKAKAKPKAKTKAAPKAAAKPAGKAKRTTHRSSTGKKLYAVRDKSGKFKDIQTFERAHRADLARKSKAEKKAKK